MSAADCRSPSLAGIAGDPQDPTRRLVPASARPDGSVRKELRVRPGFVPSEDVAKYKVGGGSIRAQHAAAQANFQAPPSPSPAAREEAPRRPNPSDFVPRDKPQYPTSSPSKPARGGASTSRWASTSAEAAPTIAPPERPAVLKPTRGRGGRQRGTGRGGRSPAMTSTDVFVKPSLEDHEVDSVAESESIASDAPPLVPSTSEVPEKDPLSLSMEWPDDNPNAEWWQDEPEDLDVDAAAQALQAVSITDPPKQAPSSSSITAQRDESVSKRADRAPASPPKPGRNDRRGPKEPQNGKGRPNRAVDTFSKNAGKASQTQSATFGPQASQKSDLLSRMEPRSKAQASAQISESQVGLEQREAESIPVNTDVWAMSLQEIRDRAAHISTELRQLAQLRRFEASGAVLVAEQSTRLAGQDALKTELTALSVAVNSLRDTLGSNIAAVT